MTKCLQMNPYREQLKELSGRAYSSPGLFALVPYDLPKVLGEEELVTDEIE